MTVKLIASQKFSEYELIKVFQTNIIIIKKKNNPHEVGRHKKIVVFRRDLLKNRLKPYPTRAFSGWFYKGGGGRGLVDTKCSRPFSLKRLKLLQSNLIH